MDAKWPDISLCVDIVSRHLSVGRECVGALDWVAHMRVCGRQWRNVRKVYADLPAAPATM